MFYTAWGKPALLSAQPFQQTAITVADTAGVLGRCVWSQLTILKSRHNIESSRASRPAQTIMKPQTAAWKYFDANKDKLNFAECKLCKVKFAGGGTKSSSFNTSNLQKNCVTKVLVLSAIVSVSTRSVWSEKKWYRASLVKNQNEWLCQLSVL